MHGLFANMRFREHAKSLRRLLSGTDDGTRGVAAIEFAIIAPVFVLMLVCTVDMGMGFYRKMQVQNAAQAGAQYAAVSGFLASSISSAVVNATPFAGITASPAPSQFCGCASNSGVTNVACGSACPGGSSPGTYVTVSAQGTYTTLFAYPGIAGSFTFLAQPTVRIQ